MTRRRLTIDKVVVGDDKPDEELQLLQAAINAATADTHRIVAGVPGKKIRVPNMHYRAYGTVTLTWKSGSDALGGPEALEKGWGVSDRWAPFGYFFETAEGEDLNLELSDSVQVTGWLNYHLV